MEQTIGDVSLTPTTPKGRYRWYLIASIIISTLAIIDNVIYDLPISINKTILGIILIILIAELLWAALNVAILPWVLIKKFERRTLLLPCIYILSIIYHFFVFDFRGEKGFVILLLPMFIALGTSIYLISRKRLSNEPWPREKQEENKNKRPSLVGVICILGFLGVPLAVLASLMNLFPPNNVPIPPEIMSSPSESIFSLVLAIPVFVSLVLIWKMKKKGLILFSVLFAITGIFMVLARSSLPLGSLLADIVSLGILWMYYKRFS